MFDLQEETSVAYSFFYFVIQLNKEQSNVGLYNTKHITYLPVAMDVKIQTRITILWISIYAVAVRAELKSIMLY